MSTPTQADKFIATHGTTFRCTPPVSQVRIEWHYIGMRCTNDFTMHFNDGSKLTGHYWRTNSMGNYYAVNNPV